jgi:D-3-phosphoglycerate dehydrogenase / 2-oxoglutarate reductase
MQSIAGTGNESFGGPLEDAGGCGPVCGVVTDADGLPRARRVAILGTRYTDFSVEERILGSMGIEIRSGDGSTEEAITEEAEGAEVILTGSSPRFDASTLKRLTCRGIVRYGVGTDSIDLDAAARRGMWVAYVPDYGTEAVTLHAVTLILAGLRRLIAADALVKAGGWGFDRLRPLHAPSALTAGVVGLGRIGGSTAMRLSDLGFRVLAHDPQVQIPEGLAEPVSLPRLLSESDVVSLHAPGDTDSKPLIGSEEIAQMKPGAVLVNTARGSLIDQAALIEGLARDRPALAALDVYPEEPPDLSRLGDVMDRVILTPHMAWYTEESEIDLRTKAAEEARRILVGESPLNPAASPLEGST